MSVVFARVFEDWALHSFLYRAISRVRGLAQDEDSYSDRERDSEDNQDAR